MDTEVGRAETLPIAAVLPDRVRRDPPPVPTVAKISSVGSVATVRAWSSTPNRRSSRVALAESATAAPISVNSEACS